MEALLAKYPTQEIHEGDLFVANDPFVAGGTHLPDVNLAMPVFAEGRLVALRLQHRAPRRHRRHGARQHGGRHVGDLPGGAAHPGAQAVPPRRAAAGPARSDAAQRARAGGAARRLFRPDRGLPARRAAARGGDRGPWARRGRGGLRRAARAHRGAHAGGDPRRSPTAATALPTSWTAMASMPTTSRSPSRSASRASASASTSPAPRRRCRAASTSR